MPNPMYPHTFINTAVRICINQLIIAWPIYCGSLQNFKMINCIKVLTGFPGHKRMLTAIIHMRGSRDLLRYDIGSAVTAKPLIIE